MQNYGKRLKEARKAKGLTQVELAEILDISQTSYQRMETGEHDMKMSNILKICRTLDVSADWLIGVDERAVATKGIRKFKATGTKLQAAKSAKPIKD